MCCSLWPRTAASMTSSSSNVTLRTRSGSLTNYPLRGLAGNDRSKEPRRSRYYCNGILATRCDAPAYPATAQRTASCATARVALSLFLSHGTRSLPPQARSIGRLSWPLARGAHARLVRLRLHDLRRLGQFVLARRMPLMIRRRRSSAYASSRRGSAAARTVATSGRAPGRAPFSSTAGTSRHGRRARSSSWGATQGIMTTSEPRVATFSQGPLNPVYDLVDPSSPRLSLSTRFRQKRQNIRWLLGTLSSMVHPLGRGFEP